MLLIYPACFISLSLKELDILHTLFIIKILGHITHHFGQLTKILGNIHLTLVSGDIASG